MTGFALVTAVTATVVVASALLARDAEKRGEQALAGLVDDLASASQAELAAEQMVAAARGYIVTTDLGLLGEVKTDEAALDDALRALGRATPSQRERALLDAVRLSGARYRGVVEGLVARKGASWSERLLAGEFRESLTPARADLTARLQELVASAQQLEAAERESAQRSAAHALHLIVGLGVAGIALSALLAVLFIRRLASLHRSQEDATWRALAATASRDELLAVVAHDLRSPLASIVWRASMLKSCAKEPETQRSAQSIGEVAMRMNRLVQDLLDAATMESRKFSVDRARCLVSDLLESTVETFAVLASQKSIALTQEADSGVFAVWGERERILQVLSNLVGNAIKFTPEQGRVVIRVAGVGSCTRFQVRDSGPGIDLDHIPLVFDRYWKAKAGSRQGSGLGLYIAKGIVDAHGGRIWVESQVGQGTSFFFELPAAPNVEEATRPLSASGAATLSHAS